MYVYRLGGGFHFSNTDPLETTDVIHALGLEPTRYNTRFVAVICLTFILFMHGTLPKWGLRLQNSLGLFKLLILSAISVCGLLSLAGVQAFAVKEGYDKPRNFESWEKVWEGSRGDANAFVTGLYNVIWYVSRITLEADGD